MKVLENLLYTKEHEWLKIEGDKAYLGITDYAQSALGSIVFIELPEADTEFAEGDNFAVIESVKAASDVYMPVDAKIIEVNEAIVDDPALVNEDAYENWMVLFEIKDRSQLEGLLKAEDYKVLCSKEE